MDWREIREAVCEYIYLTSIIVIVSVALLALAYARDLGQWEGSDAAIGVWFCTLMQPDAPNVSCCGEADAYWADRVATDGDQTIAIITDDRPDEPLMRHHVPVGTRIVVPPNKIKWDRGNPTGHIVIFLTPANDVYCYVQNGGV